MATHRRILVCGAAGFIGQHLVAALAERPDLSLHATWHRSPPARRPGVRYVQCDLRDPAQVDGVVRGMDVVLHAAATTSGAADIVGRPAIHVTDNAVMGSLLFRAAHEHGVGHVVFPSCTIMYPSRRAPLAEDDFDANAPMHPAYFGAGWTKVYLEKQCEFFARQGRTRFTVVRHSNVYGPGDKFDLARAHVFGATVAKVLGSTTGRVEVWGDGSEARDLLYVGDLVDYVLLALERQASPFELHNVGTGEAMRIDALVARVIALSGRDLQIVHLPDRPTIKTQVALDTTRARRAFGWQPRTSLDEGIRRTLAWYRERTVPAPAGEGAA